MAVFAPLAPAFETRAERAAARLAGLLALAGGLVLVLVTAITVTSIVGRALIGLGLAPVPGDFEIVQAGCGFALCAFLPICQLRRGHVTVDILFSALRPAATAWTALLGNVLMTLVTGLLFWRLVVGMFEKVANGETTFILQMPVWWMYLGCSVGLAAAVVVSAYTVWRSVNAIAAADWARA
jgi:TRAP-type mannitol/chloroaromatic compound transport system permease small subunit